MTSSAISPGTDGRRTARLRIEGRVQGVGYRAWLERRAKSSGLTGWVRNRRDGGVEAVISGQAAALAAIIADCHQGPGPARVAMVKVLEEPAFEGDGFAVLPTV